MSTDPEPGELAVNALQGSVAVVRMDGVEMAEEQHAPGPEPGRRRSRSGACPGEEQDGRSTCASSGARATATLAHSSNASWSPLGEDTATSAASSRSNRPAASAACASTQGSMPDHFDVVMRLK